MKTVAETSYAFISNDLRGPNLRSLDPTCSESSESDRVRNQVDDRYHGPELPKHIYSQPVRIENGRQNLPPIKGPAERKIRGQSSISRLRNSLSSDAIKLMLLRPNVQTPQNHEVCSRSRDSSPSSSSSYPFSPSCEWNVPLLRKFRRAKSAQRLDAHKQPDLSGVVGLPATGLDPFRNTVTTIPPIKSTALFTQKAKQVWTALERKFSHLHKLPESQSTGNLRHSAPLREKTLEQSARYNTDLCLGQTGCELPGHLCQICWARFQQHLCSEHPVKATEGLTCLVPNTNRKLATIHTHNPNRPVRDWRQHSHCVIGEPGSKDLHGYAIHRFSNHINAQCLQVGDPLSRPSRSVCGSCDEGEASRREACNVSAVSAPNELKQTPHNQSAHPVYFVCKNNPLQETRELLIARREIGERYGMRVETTAQGVYLTTVIRGSPAAHAGLKVGDELLQLNGFPLGQLSAQTIMEMIRSTPQSLRIVYRPR
ncbi:uncharacterized protein DEA37_0004231 [Paragonimus westermani]|uniref:PDZ domain-containing protein n=1 Tax=Paragonimus westermani TaxID=34504 RepID=A0A5J4P3P0_9TREM|nr:uncharacterized protein DEA37_0004231 [Paragonimus westermani]